MFAGQLFKSLNDDHAYFHFFDAKSNKILYRSALFGGEAGKLREDKDGHKHSFDEHQVIKSVGGAGGYVLKVCKDCGYTEKTTEGYNEEEALKQCPHNIFELNHSCTDSSHVWNYCSLCKATEIIEKTLKPAEDIIHQFFSTIHNPTCTEGGYTHRECQHCGLKEDVNPTPALGHTPASGLDVVITPTCQHGGYTIHTCSRCNEKYIDSYKPACDHTYVNAGPVKHEATCAHGEYTTNRCIYCDKEIVVGEVGQPDPNVHSYDRDTRSLTCTSKGCFSHICRDCGHMKTVYFEEDPESKTTEEQNTPRGHVEDTKVAPKVVAPTETEPGYTIRRCAECGKDYITDPTSPTGEVHETKTYHGQDVPDSSFGQDGDIYVDEFHGVLYLYKDDNWKQIAGKKIDPRGNVFLSEDFAFYANSNSPLSPEERMVVYQNLDKIKVSGVTDDMRYEFQKYVLQKCFPNLWKQVSIDNFLKDERNVVSVHAQVSVNTIDAHLGTDDLKAGECPYIEFSFSPKAIVHINSPVYGNYFAEQEINPEEFKQIDASITVTIPVCGKFDVDHIVHKNTVTGDVINIFTKAGLFPFIHDKEANTVTVSVPHFSSLRVNGPVVPGSGGGDEPSGGDAGYSPTSVSNTGDTQVPLLTTIIFSIMILALIATNVSRKRFIRND